MMMGQGAMPVLPGGPYSHNMHQSYSALVCQLSVKLSQLSVSSCLVGIECTVIVY